MRICTLVGVADFHKDGHIVHGCFIYISQNAENQMMYWHYDY